MNYMQRLEEEKIKKENWSRKNKQKREHEERKKAQDEGTEEGLKPTREATRRKSLWTGTCKWSV